MSRQHIVDLFAGCGGLSEGFRSSNFDIIGSVEWEKACIETIKANTNAARDLYHVDIRNYDSFLTSRGGLLDLNERHPISGIIGGPPCQAYSLAGRIRCPDGMKDDYRNFLFEAYIEVLGKLQPDFFVFENVLGMLSARPGEISVVERLTHSFEKAGYAIPEINKEIVFDLAELGGPQFRRRVILFGVNRSKFPFNANDIVRRFYSVLNSKKSKPTSTSSAIGDLPILLPLPTQDGRKSHQSDSQDPLHQSRFHNARDIEIFHSLALDAKSPNPQYRSIEALKRLYTQKTGKTAAVHKYFVLYPNRPSNLIPAHLHKDGLRHIHYDHEQARTITMREAARLQTFPDSFIFKGSQTDIFKMIGNAVPPLMAKKIAESVSQVLP